MKFLVLTGLIGGFALGFGQDPIPPKGSDLYRTVKPQVTISVRKHSLGADLVEISMLDARYPPELLRKQVENIGLRLNSPPVAVTFFRDDLGFGTARGAVLKATFAVNGLIDQQNHHYRVGPLAQAFAGAPAEFEIRGLSVIFQKERASNSTLREYRSASVDVQGVQQSGDIGIEFRVLLKSQKPEEILIPDDAVNRSTAPTRLPPASKDDRLFWCLIIGSGLALGALVYSLLIRTRPSGSHR